MPLPSPQLRELPRQASCAVRIRYEELLEFVTDLFALRGLAPERAATAAEALCYGDLTGLSSHGLANLTRLYLPLFDEGRVDPAAEPEILADRGAAVLLDARRALGLWAAGLAMDLAVERAARFGIGLVSVRGGTHLGCAGHHAARAVRGGMVGIVASNCGGQRIARPPGGRLAMLGTNPLSVAAPAGEHHPFVLDMSTTVVPTGRIRAAARAGQPVPAGWLADDQGLAVTDPAALDRGEAHLRWLGGDPATGAYKGYGLGLVVEVLSALVGGAALGPAAAALDGDGGPSGRDDDIGYLVAAIAPGTLRPQAEFARDSAGLFATLLGCPPVSPAEPVRYPGWLEGERARAALRDGVPLDPARYAELAELAAGTGLRLPAALGGEN
ncbi:Ldh family oxidoreductase [Streptacidiphilus sp. P02-A3a]|uniref:Ldh family oxidoreductase n=1 Tax=Streptacidiphilus sp. P02-A3a TaxID=2704468 RepID=UPI0015FD20D1|nr:Ldh family oxidoreductase [Streptacidiphilus sp. P02-A3a]QMU71332.1 Ldh family oxidoreductase [Streptacidiphilus sp. P02-A3a]